MRVIQTLKDRAIPNVASSNLIRVAVFLQEMVFLFSFVYESSLFPVTLDVTVMYMIV